MGKKQEKTASGMECWGEGHTDRFLGDDEAVRIIGESVERMGLRGKKVLALIPDSTRTCPLPLFFRTLCERLGPVAKQLDFMIALGTHPAMAEEAIDKLLGVSGAERAKKWAKHKIINHAWDDPSAIKEVGRITKDEISKLTGGLFAMGVPVTVNRLVDEYDTVLVVGPVFPHEVVGFSGGNKYIFPGVAGREIIDFFHWLGAVITNPRIIGNKMTKTRAVVDRAAQFIKADRKALCMVVKDHKLAGLFAGTTEAAWSAAADLSAQVHVHYVDKPFKRILSCAPEMYDDIWTAGKCMYKMEPIVADGGELIIYAPHVTEISYTHGKIIDKIGYHCRDFFLADWEKYKKFPWGVVAHSTHVRGIGKMENGVEKCRVAVTLATGIPEARCRKVNLGYMDPKKIDKKDFEGREAEGILCVPRAGEVLYRLKKGPEWQRA
jgi:lactate racemase